jgi:hypothetical protein
MNLEYLIRGLLVQKMVVSLKLAQHYACEFLVTKIKYIYTILIQLTDSFETNKATCKYYEFNEDVHTAQFLGAERPLR